jgi:adenosylhomocysteinase
LAVDHDVADPALATAGAGRIAWAAARMPVLRSIGQRFGEAKPFAGIRIGACLHVTPETAVLIATLAAGGAEVALCASNPLSTKDDVAASLVVDHEVATFARRGEGVAVYASHVQAVASREPHITIDDGCDLIERLHSSGPERLRSRVAAADLLGGTEDTTTGAAHLRAMAAAGVLTYPVVSLSEATTRAMADNRYGTGQSVLDGIVRATNTLLAGAKVVVAGYGNCGRGVAARARGMGASVIVTEANPLRALEAVLDGYEVMTMRAAAARGNVFVTATGNRDVITAADFAEMPDGAILANAGHFDVEIDVKALAELAGGRRRPVRPGVEEFTVGGRGLLLLCEGRLVNLAAADGNPAQVMDISFAVQALACEWLVRHRGELEPAVYGVPAEIDGQVASLKLATMGIEVDELSPGQLAYLKTFGG